MKICYSIVLFSLVLLTQFVFAQSDIFNAIKEAVRAGNAKEAVKYFNKTVDINLEGAVNTHSKAQAEFVLQDFFKKHPITDFTIVHTGSSKGGLQFAIGKYQTANESFNVLMRVRDVGGVFLVHEISFIKE